MALLPDLVRKLQNILERDSRFTDGLFTDYRYVFGSERVCHELTIDAIFKAAAVLDGVSKVTGNKTVMDGMRPPWKPDAVLWSARDEQLGIVEFETLNSSDARVFDKDMWGYRSWVQHGAIPRVPLLIITTLPNRPCPNYMLLYTRGFDGPGKSQGNSEPSHRERLAEIRENPFLYWYRYYRERIEEEEWGFPAHFANFDGKRLELIDLRDNKLAPPVPR